MDFASTDTENSVGGHRELPLRERHDAIVDAVGDGVYQLDTEGRIVDVNDAVVEMTGYSRRELMGEHVSLLLDDEDIARCVDEIQRLLAEPARDVGIVDVAVRTATGGTIPAEDRLALLRSGGEFVGTVGVIRDVSRRRARERTLERQRCELRRLDRINSVIRDVVSALVEADSCSDIDRAVCACLTRSTPYAAAWIADVDVDGSVTPRTTGALDDEDLDRLLNRGAARPIEKAANIDGIVVVQDLGRSMDVRWHRAAVALGYRSAAVIPLQFDGRNYGALTLYADRPNVFSAREQTVLDELGRAIGHATNAIERKAALLTEHVIELKLQAPELAEPFRNAIDGRFDRITIDRTLSMHDGVLVYYSVDGMETEQFVDVMESLPNVNTVRRIGGDGAETSRFVARTRGETMASLVASFGGRVLSGTIRPGGLFVTAEAPYGTDVRRVVEAVEEVYPSVELVAQTVGRSTATSPALGEVVEEELTERQQTVLEAAYYGGYFEWPRDNTGEEVAASLDVTPPTMHEHLRAAQRKLLGPLLQSARK